MMVLTLEVPMSSLSRYESSFVFIGELPQDFRLSSLTTKDACHGRMEGPPRRPRGHKLKQEAHSLAATLLFFFVAAEVIEV